MITGPLWQTEIKNIEREGETQGKSVKNGRLQVTSYSRASSQLNLLACSTTWGNRCTNLFWKIICGASLAWPFVSLLCYILLSILVNRAEYITERVNKLGQKMTFWLTCQKQMNWENLRPYIFLTGHETVCCSISL